ncbi:NUDIX domain-containing protein [Parathermosynechococcus lividus]
MKPSSMYRHPAPTVDIIIELLDYPQRPILLIERRYPPLGWAIPGGFVDYGESVEVAAQREAREEVSLEITLQELLYVYSDPARDPRQHTLSTVFIATAHGTPVAADDAKAVHIVPLDQLPSPLCFDHEQILKDYLHWRRTGQRPRPHPS